jgi:hypothetical protein
MIDWILANPAEAALATLGVTTSAAMFIRVLIPALSAIAAKTTTKADDEAVTRLASGLDWLIVALDAARRMLPRVVVGPLPSTQPIATSTRPQPTALAVSVPPPPVGGVVVPPIIIRRSEPLLTDEPPIRARDEEPKP